MKPIFILSVVSLLFFSDPCSAQQAFPKDYFSSPVDFQIYLSSSFAEIRTDHFHSGIDIKTRGRAGEIIRSVADGHISRISVSPGGYGRALYIDHPNGYTSVYGHLSRFSPEIESYVKEKQYEKQTFALSLFPAKDQFSFKKGDLIGYSGNTGSSLGAHLHFEIRETATEHPTNVLLYGFNIKDNTPPVISSLLFYPLNDTSSIMGSGKRMEFSLTGSNGSYRLKQQGSVRLSGKIGLAVETYDRMDGSYNKCGVYSIEVLEDNNLVSNTVFDEFAFSETRYVNSNIDYSERIESGRKIRKCFIEANNRLRIYAGTRGDGSVLFREGDKKLLKIIISDSHGNKSVLEFSALGTAPAIIKDRKEKNRNDYLMLMPYQIENTYSFNGFEIDIPKDAFYDSVYFRLVISPPSEGIYSWIYHVHDKHTPVHKSFKLGIEAEEVPEGLEDKLLLAGMDDNNKIFARGGEYKDGKVFIRTREFGKYFVCIDTIAPEIIPNNFIPSKGKNLSSLKKLDFVVRDEFSGINKYEGFIDGKWMLFEYDPKNDKLFHFLDQEKIEKGKDHELLLRLSDMKNNIAEFRFSFFW